MATTTQKQDIRITDKPIATNRVRRFVSVVNANWEHNLVKVRIGHNQVCDDKYFTDSNLYSNKTFRLVEERNVRFLSSFGDYIVYVEVDPDAQIYKIGTYGGVDLYKANKFRIVSRKLDITIHLYPN
jgi:hypothetical protein